MKISELKSWIKDLPDDAEITLFISNEGEASYSTDIKTLITTSVDGVARYYLHGGEE